MTDVEIFTPESPFLTTLADKDGATWQFAYWGSRYVYIREVINDYASEGMPLMGDRASRDDWPHLVDVLSYGLRPDDITRAWLIHRAATWITDRNDDLRKGNL